MVAMESSAPALTDSHQVSRKTNFSIAAIMSGLQARTETEAKLEREEPAEGLEKIIKKHSPHMPNLSVSKFINRRHDISRHQVSINYVNGRVHY